MPYVKSQAFNQKPPRGTVWVEPRIFSVLSLKKDTSLELGYTNLKVAGVIMRQPGQGSTLFNISNFVVAQTNFHVVPFLNKAHHPNINTLYWKMFQMCMWDVKSRVMNLSQLGLFPKFFGQDLSKVSV